MAKPLWTRTLAEVLKHATQSVNLTSEKTGNTYQADVIPSLQVVSIGSVEEIDGKYRYSVVDTSNDLEYAVKAPEKIAVKFGTVLRFTNVRGGALANGLGWYAADTVSEVTRNA